MLSHLPQTTRDKLNRAFPERQIIHRTSGQVHCFVIGQKLQIAAVTGFALIAAWCLFTIINLFFGNNPFGSQAKEIRRMESQYERLLEDARAKEANARALLDAQHREFTQAAASFEEKHKTLTEILGQGVVDTPTAPIKTVQYASQNILMSPVTRDVFPRQSRINSVTSTDASTSNLQGASFVGLSSDQNTILIQAESTAQDAIERNRAIIRNSGLDVDTVLRSGPFGTGGPLIELGTSAPEEGNFGSRVESIRARVSEADALNRAVLSLPVGKPILDDHYSTSTYGPRKDPFTKRTAFHNGVDYSGRRMTDIVATAPGTVSYVGMNGGYGRVVEIDHDHGIKTRYAHLAKSYVKRGQIIATGEKIGGMGSTGRSTSTHLHYEILFQGRATDPRKFMKAGRYVQQN